MRGAQIGLLAVYIMAIAAIVVTPASAETQFDTEAPAAIEERASKEKKATSKKPVVQSITWIGNETISHRTLRAHILTQSTTFPLFWVAHKFREDDLAGDMDRITALYRLRGYYQAKASYSVAREEGSRTVAIEIRIEEGAPIHTYQVGIRLANGHPISSHPLIEDVAWDAFLESIQLQQGEIFELNDYREARAKILAFVAERGLPEARLVGGAQVDLRLHRAIVDWQLVPGRHIRLGEVRISGLHAVDENILRREIRVKPGETYSVSRLARDRRRLQNLSLFRWTVVEAVAPKDTEEGADEKDEGSTQTLDGNSPAGEATWPVDVRVAERPPRRIRMGGGWGTDTSFRAELSWHHRNFFGGARHADVSVRYSGIGALLRPTFTEPYFLGTQTQLRISPAYLLEKQEAYDARRILFDVRLKRRLTEHWKIRLGYRFDRDDVYSVEQEASGEADLPEGVSITTGPLIGLIRSTVDNRLNAHSGTILDLRAETSVSALGSDEDFIRYTVSARSFFELFSTVIASRVLLGTIQPLANTQPDDVPLVERFFSGGSSSMRGVGYRELGPEDIDGNSIGGASLVESSIEWRIPVFRDLGIVGFIDAAFLGPDAWSWRLDKLRYAAGPGLRYKTPAGPIRVDFAWRLNPDSKRGNFRISASLGHMF
ncbi:MAG TPA: hypothetical protein EYG46_04330 [Myxococcales bacterium]|nr:hypothetical protein [Myxococcales bacterium]